MFKTFLCGLVTEVKSIFKEEQIKIEIWNHPQRVTNVSSTEIWVVEGSKDYCPTNFHDSVDNFSVYIRAKYNNQWYMANKHGCPVGAPYEDKVVGKWKLLKRIG